MRHASTEGGTGEGDGVLATFARNLSTTRLPRRRFDSDMRSSGRCAWSYTYQCQHAHDEASKKSNHAYRALAQRQVECMAGELLFQVWNRRNGLDDIG